MNDFAEASIEPSYIVPLALKEAPFSVTDDARFFFKSEQVEQRFNLLLHLIRASDKVALVFAEQGFGKSVLLMQLYQAMNEDVRTCQINATPDITGSALTLDCLSQLGVDQNDVNASSDHNVLLKQRCQGLHKLNIKPLLLLDDVDSLSEETLVTVLDWLSWQEGEQFLLQAILTAKNAMPGLNTIHGRIQRVDVPALAESELSCYLSHRLTTAGYQGKFPFKAKVLTQIFKRSAGNPELINQLAHQQLLGINPVSESRPFHSISKWLGIGIIVILLSLLLAFQDKINELFTAEESKPELDEFTELPPEQPIAMIVAEPEPEPEPEPSVDDTQAARAELEALVAELPEASLALDESSIPTAEIPVIDLEKINTEIQENSQHNWILQQDSTHYTFQLMGSWEKEKVREYGAKYGLSEDVAIFESDRGGRVWYALIYGVFDSKEAALKASDAWSAPLNALPTWLRRFDSVQQQITPSGQ